MDALALILTVAAMVMFLFAASGRELRRFNEIAVGLVLLAAALICQFTSITNTHIGRLARAGPPARAAPGDGSASG
jgi:predicted metal-binding membrane protein